MCYFALNTCITSLKYLLKNASILHWRSIIYEIARCYLAHQWYMDKVVEATPRTTLSKYFEDEVREVLRKIPNEGRRYRTSSGVKLHEGRGSREIWPNKTIEGPQARDGFGSNRPRAESRVLFYPRTSSVSSPRVWYRTYTSSGTRSRVAIS